MTTRVQQDLYAATGKQLTAKELLLVGNAVRAGLAVLLTEAKTGAKVPLPPRVKATLNPTIYDIPKVKKQ